MMTKEQYNAQRTKLLNDMRTAIDAGDIETSNAAAMRSTSLTRIMKLPRRPARIWPRWKTATAATTRPM